MQPSELKIGNYISRLDIGSQNPRTEIILELRKYVCTTTGPIQVIVLYNDINPIPLTEEWFLNFGFDKIDFKHGDNSVSENVFKIDRIVIEKSDEYGWLLSMIRIGQPWKTDYIRSFKYVHQLQNICFELTEKELTIKN